MSSPYDYHLDRLVRFVCENPHVAKDVIAAMDFLKIEEILDVFEDHVDGKITLLDVETAPF